MSRGGGPKLVDGGGRPRLVGEGKVSKWRWKARLVSGRPKLVSEGEGAGPS